MTLQQRGRRIGGTAKGGFPEHALGSYGGHGVSPLAAFTANDGLIAPGHQFAWLAQRHMYLYGTKREHLAEICISQRNNALRRPDTALFKTPLTLDDYFNARMISDPLCLFDYTMESDGAVAVITTSRRTSPGPPSAPRRTSRDRPWRRLVGPFHLLLVPAPDDYFASSGHRPVARRVYEMAGVGPATSTWRCSTTTSHRWCSCSSRTTGSPRSVRAARSLPTATSAGTSGTIPVNTHGGNLSEAYIIGMTHVTEAVEQIRG